MKADYVENIRSLDSVHSFMNALRVGLVSIGQGEVTNGIGVETNVLLCLL